MSEYDEWINSFHDFVKADEGKLYVIKTSDDLVQVYEDLERAGV